MALHLISIHHAEHGLEAVQAASPAVPGLGHRVTLASPAVRGAVVLSTCNRVEVYVDTDTAVGDVAALVHEALGVQVPCTVREDVDALQHLFDVGAGLDSMVVGEREIAGQLRKALKQAHAEGTATGLLTETIEQALRTARKVSHLTQLAATGRSVVSVGLDLLSLDWAATDVLLLGTGAYAGAVVADLRQRTARTVSVHSSSGRAAHFVASHPDTREAPQDLVTAVTGADVVVTCRGLGTPVLSLGHIEAVLAGRGERPLTLIDLAVARDIDARAGDLPGVLLLDLPTIQRHVPAAATREVGRARTLVDEGVRELMGRLTGRAMDPAVIALRDAVNAMVCDEVARLPQGRPVTTDEAAHALRRLAARLVHVPSVRARKAAVEGRADEYLHALSELWGIESQPRPVLRRLTAVDATPAVREVAHADEAVPPDTLEVDTCPVTGLGLGDLGARPRREAM